MSTDDPRYEAACALRDARKYDMTPTEADPTGRSPHEPGAKLDAGKNRLGLVLGGFSRALQEVGKVGTYGAGKYSDNGWMEVPDGEQRYTDALFRHLLAESTGEQNDPDTGLRHAAHACWNSLARLELQIRRSDAYRTDVEIQKSMFEAQLRAALNPADRSGNT